MKKLILFLLISSAIFAQTSFTGSKKDTILTGTTERAYKPTNIPTLYTTLTLFTVSGTDTVTVETASKTADRVYSQKCVIDMLTGCAVNSIIVTTTKKEYIIYDPQVWQFKVKRTYGLVDLVVHISGRQ